MPIRRGHSRARESLAGPVPPVNRVRLCCLGILADKSIEDRPSVYPRPGKIRDRWWVVSTVGGSCRRAW
jgi:hypothetical protein